MKPTMKKITDKQRRYIERLVKTRKGSEALIGNLNNLDKLDREEASNIITQLEQLPMMYAPIVEEENKEREEKEREEKLSLYKIFMEILESPDLIMLFGETGSCKSVIALELLRDATRDGHNAIYIDTEGNLREREKPEQYCYIPNFDELKKQLYTLPDGFKLVILDSIGLPVLGSYANENFYKRGSKLLDLEAIAYNLKNYAVRNNSMVLITNQPISELSAMTIEDAEERKQAIQNRRPFGDKMMYFVKEVLRSRIIETSKDKTVVMVDAYRSRKYGRGRALFTVKVSDQGIDIWR